MLNWIKKILRSFKWTSTLLDVFFVKKFYLDQKGWTLSRSHYRPMDNNGSELPWFTYSSIYFIDSCLRKEYKVFEFGSGNSTLFFSRRVAQIRSVESDSSFYDSMKSKLKQQENVEYLFRAEENTKFAKSITEVEESYDIIIIDGADRINCAKYSLQSLNDEGVIVWDNSDRIEYQEGYDFLVEQGFRKIDFFGHGPIGYREWCTSIFYRPGNCFNI